jgi:hypothetical protein
MNKLFLYVMMFAVAAIVNPLIHSCLKPLKQFGVAPMTIGIISSIVFYLLMLTFAQIVIVLNESKPTEYLPAAIDDYPSLDWEPLQRYTRELESLGFHQLIDYRPSNLTRSGLARLFAHSEHHCFVEVYQISGLPTICVVRTIFTDGWSLCNMNYQSKGLLGGLTYMRRRKRSLWIAQPNHRPTELLSHHLERRTQLMEDLNIDIVIDISPEAYFVHEKLEAKLRLQIMKSKWIVFCLIDAIGYMIHPKFEWMGEYHSKRGKGKGERVKGKG